MALLYFCSECFFESIFVFHVGVFLFDLLIGLFKVTDFVLGVFELFFGEVVGEVFDEFVHVDSVVWMGKKTTLNEFPESYQLGLSVYEFGLKFFDFGVGIVWMLLWFLGVVGRCLCR